MEKLQVEIEKLAYELFVARGGTHGYHIQDWLKAEKEVKNAGKKSKKKKKK